MLRLTRFPDQEGIKTCFPDAFAHGINRLTRFPDQEGIKTQHEHRLVWVRVLDEIP